MPNFRARREKVRKTYSRVLFLILCFLINSIGCIFHENPRIFQDPWVGTDTPGPGEAVFAIRFEGNPLISMDK